MRNKLFCIVVHMLCLTDRQNGILSITDTFKTNEESHKIELSHKLELLQFPCKKTCINNLSV